MFPLGLVIPASIPPAMDFSPGLAPLLLLVPVLVAGVAAYFHRGADERTVRRDDPRLPRTAVPLRTRPAQKRPLAA